MKKIYLLLFTVLAFGVGAYAQPAVLGTQLANGSYTTYNLNSIGLFRQYRLQASSSAAISTRNWEFASGTAASPDYTTNWRPYTSNNTLSSNLFIPTSFANGAKYNTASGGASGLLPVITAGNYYTFNVDINSAADNSMELLETTYNPVTITSVSNTTPLNASNSVLVTCTTSAAPSAGENVYVRYSTNVTFTTSALAQFTFTGTTGQALIPCQPAGLVYYYVMSSNQTSAQITADATANGKIAYDMATLNLNNNGGPNYSYTQGSATNFGGIYSVPSPSCYTTVGAFVTALNAGTVTAPVTCYAIGGSPTETATVGGIEIDKTGTAANPIVFQKFGSGSYTIQASSALTVGTLSDALIKIVGADYITIDGFTLQENSLNTTNSPNGSNNMTEWGIALLHASTTDGAQNNTIQNNTITLSRSYVNSFGIYSNVKHSATAPTGSQDIANNTTAPNNGNKVYGNNISNVNAGITFIGSGISANEDVNNDIGGSSSATGNTISNWGGLAQASTFTSNSGTSYCIFINNQTNDNISYNTISSAAVSGTSVTFCGIRKDNTGAQPTGTISSNITNNTITMSSGFTTGTFDAILNQGMTALSTATININNNSILNNVMNGAASSSSIIGIANSSVPGVLNMNNNIIRGNTSTSTTGGFIAIQNTGAVVTTINITGNQIGSSSTNAITMSAGTNSQIIGINNVGGTTTTTVNVTNNAIQGLNEVSSSNNTYGIVNSSSAGVAVNITGNTLGSSSRDFATFSTTSTGPVYGILNSGGASTTNLTVTGNTVDRINGSSFSNTVAGIANTSSGIGGTLNLNNNAIGTTTGTFITTGASSSATIYAMWNSNGTTTATVNMNNNTVDGFFINSTTVNLTTMACNGANIATASVMGNSFGSTGTLIQYSGTQPATGTFRVIDLGSGSSNATSTITCQNNIIKGINYLVTGAATTTGIFINATPLTATISGNQFNNLSVNISGNVWMILDIASRASGETLTVNNNSIVTGLTKTASGGLIAGEYSAGSSVDGAILNITNNNFSNITAVGNSNVYGVVAVDGNSSVSGPTETITGNTVSNITAASGSVWGIYSDFSAAATIASNTISAINSNYVIYGIDFENNNGQGTFNAYSNIINNLASTGASGHVRGILANSTSVPTFNIYSNTITNLSSAGLSNLVNGVMFNNGQAANIYDNIINNLTDAGNSVPLAAGLNIIAGTTLNIYRNKIHTIAATGNFTATSTIAEGIRITNGTTVNVYNNFVSNLTAPTTSYTDVIRGIDVSSATASSNYNLYYNSVYLNAASTGTDFGTSGIYHLTNASGTTGALSMIDNIIVNTSLANGGGVTAAYRRSDATLTNYASTSDYNLFYAGTPLATKLIYYDGTNSDQTLASYQALVSARDANSISALPNFTSPVDLHLSATNCSIDGAGTPIGGYTTDIDLQSRDAVTPDIGADEFTATYGPTLAGVAGSAICSIKTVSPSGTTYATSSCDLIAKVLPSGGGSAVGGKINVCVTLDAAQQTFNGEPYVQRHFDIEPASNPSTATGTITLYISDAEFIAYNTNNPLWPKLPTGTLGNADPNRANLRVTQFHGTPTTTPSTPGNYTGPGNPAIINPGSANVFWNGTYWEITFPVTGFSGFYVHSTIYNTPLSVSFNYLNGVKQGNDHLLTWSVTCNTTPRVTLTLERSPDNRNFGSIYSITADAVRCGQPFDYTDAQPLSGINYYRLKIVDADGKITYSNTIALINGTKGFALMNIAPNPVTGGSFKLNTTTAAAANMEVVISDMQGRVVHRQTISLAAGFNSTEINVSNLAPGTYNIYGITADDKSGLIRFVRQ